VEFSEAKLKTAWGDLVKYVVKVIYNMLRLKKIAFPIVVFICFFLFSIWIVCSLIKKEDEVDKNFILTAKGVLIEKKSLDRDDAKCKLLVTQSNYNKYRGKGAFGGNVILEDDTLNIILMLDHCLRIGDTIIVGPHNNLIIINKNDTLFITDKIDKCRE
jgi:hypothetical protein